MFRLENLFDEVQRLIRFPIAEGIMPIGIYFVFHETFMRNNYPMINFKMSIGMVAFSD